LWLQEAFTDIKIDVCLDFSVDWSLLKKLDFMVSAEHKHNEFSFQIRLSQQRKAFLFEI
jgi:hypothetical protein